VRYTKNNLRNDSLPPGCDINPGLLKYEAEVLTTELQSLENYAIF
jgi:hypothetical protein